MALTRSFKETVRARAQRDPAFRDALLQEAIEQFINGDVDSGLNILGNYVNATIGYPMLGKLTGKNPKSLHRMLGPNGNPKSDNIFNIIHQLKQQEGLQFDIRLRRA